MALMVSSSGLVRRSMPRSSAPICGVSGTISKALLVLILETTFMALPSAVPVIGGFWRRVKPGLPPCNPCQGMGRTVAMHYSRSGWQVLGFRGSKLGGAIMRKTHILRTGAVMLLLLASPATAQTIVEEWNTAKLPAPPQLKPAKVEAKETAVLVMDFTTQTCSAQRRPRCAASLAKIAK